MIFKFYIEFFNILLNCYICRNIFVKTRYFIFISYRGTSYHGWQIQPNSVTVQKILDDALSIILCETITTTGAGRTDTGVHAQVFCAHFDSISNDLSGSQNLVFRLNRYLPEDISVNSIKKVFPDANARYSALSRTYKYYISKVKDPFFDNSSWFLHGNINVAKMNEACKLLFNHRDFTSFSKLHSGAKTNNCKIYYASWEEIDNRLVFTIKADRFLRNMVRAIVGTLVDIGYDKTDIGEFEEIILARNRCRAGTSAPARGLFLTEIEYPETIFK
jgi:tRNA pseudouridine38-40 synthase